MYLYTKQCRRNVKQRRMQTNKTSGDRERRYKDGQRKWVASNRCKQTINTLLQMVSILNWIGAVNSRNQSYGLVQRIIALHCLGLCAVPCCVHQCCRFPSLFLHVRSLNVRFGFFSSSFVSHTVLLVTHISMVTIHRQSDKKLNDERHGRKMRRKKKKHWRVEAFHVIVYKLFEQIFRIQTQTQTKIYTQAHRNK